MIFDPPLVEARLVARYKRFLFDALLLDGTSITGFCPNTGSMRGLTEPGSRIWMSVQHAPHRKYRYQLEMVEAGGVMVGINTGLPNRLAEAAIRSGLIPGLAAYGEIRREQAYGKKSRIDLLLSDPVLGIAYVEVKNVHFSRRPGLAEFPDSPTLRGARHLEELGDMVEAGHRAIMVYLVQRPDCLSLAIASDYDPAYGQAFARAVSRGVEAYGLKCAVSPLQIVADALITMDEPGIADL